MPKIPENKTHGMNFDSESTIVHFFEVGIDWATRAPREVVIFKNKYIEYKFFDSFFLTSNQF